MTDYLDYLIRSDEWEKNPLLKIIDDKICMTHDMKHKIESILSDAISSNKEDIVYWERAVQRAKNQEDTDNRNKYVKFFTKRLESAIEIDKLIEDIPNCEES